MVVTDANHFGLVFAVIVLRRIVHEKFFLLFKLRIGNRNCRYKRSRIRMKRICKQFFRVRNLHNLALIDDADSIRNKADNRQIVSDEQICCASLSLELIEKIEHLRTD